MAKDDYTRMIAELGSLAGLLDKRAHAAVQEMESDAFYWNRDPSTFTQGIDNAVGGAPGRLAAMFTPALALSMAALIREKADQWDSEVVPFSADCTLRCPWDCKEHLGPLFHEGSGDRAGCECLIDAPDGERCTCFDTAWQVHNAYYPHAVSLDADR
jgi:hypothetical protein